MIPASFQGLADLSIRFARSAVIWGFAVSFVRAVGFFAVMAYALRKLPASDIGLWYVMLNIAGLAGIVEFGFNPTIGRFASFFMGGAGEVKGLGLPPPAPDRPNLEGLAGLVKMSRILYIRFGFLVFFLMLAGGACWLLLKGFPPIGRLNVAAFLLLSAGSGIGMACLFWHGLLFGVNRVKDYNKLLLAGLVLDYTLAAAGLVSGGGLMALVIGQLALAIFPRWLSRRRVLAMIPPEAAGRPQAVTWQDLWPTTWRSGGASLASFLTIQGTTLLCSLITDLRTTAGYGITLQLALVMHGFSANWLMVKFPEISALRSSNRTQETLGVIRRRMALAVATYASGAAFIMFLAPPILEAIRSNTRILPLPQMAAAFAIVGLDLVIGMHAAVMQTGNRVPYLVPFVVCGGLTVILGLICGSQWGVPGLLAAIFASQLLSSACLVPGRCWQDLRAACRVPGTAGGGPYV